MAFRIICGVGVNRTVNCSANSDAVPEEEGVDDGKN